MNDAADSKCSPNHVDQAGQGEGEPRRLQPTGQAGTGQSGDTAAPADYDSDPKGGGGKVQQRHDDAKPDEGGDAPSHGSR